MQGARSAATETYQVDRRRSEHRATQQMASAVVFQQPASPDRPSRTEGWRAWPGRRFPSGESAGRVLSGQSLLPWLFLLLLRKVPLPDRPAGRCLAVAGLLPAAVSADWFVPLPRGAASAAARPG